MDWRYIRFFHPNSDPRLRCRCCGKCDMDMDFMLRLDALRLIIDRPLIVTSGYRCPEHNNQVSGSGFDGPHTTGKAVDLGVRGDVADELLWLSRIVGFTGRGVQQKGERRFIHLDTLRSSTGRPRPWVWSY